MRRMIVTNTPYLVKWKGLNGRRLERLTARHLLGHTLELRLVKLLRIEVNKAVWQPASNLRDTTPENGSDGDVVVPGTPSRLASESWGITTLT